MDGRGERAGAGGDEGEGGESEGGGDDHAGSELRGPRCDGRTACRCGDHGGWLPLERAFCSADARPSLPAFDHDPSPARHAEWHSQGHLQDLCAAVV